MPLVCGRCADMAFILENLNIYTGFYVFFFLIIQNSILRETVSIPPLLIYITSLANKPKVTFG